MARIIYSALVTEIKGSIGGTTFQSNAYGYTVKNKARQKRPKTALQNIRKIYLASAAQAWRGLSQANRDAWDAWAASNPQYAKNNPSAVLSGYAVFVRQTVNRYLIQGTTGNVVTNPSYTIYPVDTVDYTLTIDGSDLYLGLTWDTASGDISANFYISQPFKETVNFAGSRVRFLIGYDSSDDSIDVTALYVALYGVVPSIGDKIFIENVQFNPNNGIVYARQSANVVVISA